MGKQTDQEMLEAKERDYHPTGKSVPCDSSVALSKKRGKSRERKLKGLGEGL